MATATATRKTVPVENDYWDVEERPISISNMEAELGRLKTGDKINLLNVSFEDLNNLFMGLVLHSEGLGEMMKQLLSKQDTMHDQILDAIRQQNNPLVQYPQPQIQPSWPSVGSPYIGTGGTSAVSMDDQRLGKPKKKQDPEAI